MKRFRSVPTASLALILGGSWLACEPRPPAATPNSPVASTSPAGAPTITPHPAPPPATAPGPVEPSESVSDPIPSEPERVDAGESGSDCGSPAECVVVRDRCGRPHGTPRRAPVAPEPVGLCPPAAYAVTEPACVHGSCQASPVVHGELRQCETTNECVAVALPCGGYLAAHEDHEAELAEAVARAAAQRSCLASTPTPPPPVECHQRICIPR